jgi:hypothetical protein
MPAQASLRKPGCKREHDEGKWLFNHFENDIGVNIRFPAGKIRSIKADAPKLLCVNDKQLNGAGEAVCVR